MEKFIQILKKNKEVSDWSIQSFQKKSCELFYVGKKLETNRATDVETIKVTIYVDRDDKRGSATFTVFNYMSEEEIEAKIRDNIYAAMFAMNPYYDIPSKEETVIKPSSSNLKDRPFSEIIEEVVDAVFQADVFENGYLSATEFFLYENTVHIVNSRGVDLTGTTYSGNVELIPSWEKEDEEVEIYHMMKFESLNTEEITREVDEQLRMAEARFNAVELTQKENLKVILQDEEAAQIFDYFVSDLSYGSKYQKINRCEVGDNVQGEAVTGDKLQVKLVPYYENAMDSKPFDRDGVVLKEISLIEDGIAKGMYGSYRFGYYLGVKHPTGILPVTVVRPGTKSFAEMAKEPYLRCVKFSGLQVEQTSGYVGGEVRLGFYFDGEKEIPVTGFSISGNMSEIKGSMFYSTETVTTTNYHGPKYLEIKNMSIA